MTGTYRILEEVALADTAFEARGDSPTELCAAAGLALCSIMADPATIGVEWRRSVECEGETLAELLFEWLERLVFLKDAHAVLFHHADLSVEEREVSPRWRLCATLVGAPIDPASQTLHADVKAVTRHLYDVAHLGDHWRARVVLDV